MTGVKQVLSRSSEDGGLPSPCFEQIPGVNPYVSPGKGQIVGSPYISLPKSNFSGLRI